MERAIFTIMSHIWLHTYAPSNVKSVGVEPMSNRVNVFKHLPPYHPRPPAITIWREDYPPKACQKNWQCTIGGIFCITPQWLVVDCTILSSITLFTWTFVRPFWWRVTGAIVVAYALCARSCEIVNQNFRGWARYISWKRFFLPHHFPDVTQG